MIRLSSNNGHTVPLLYGIANENDKLWLYAGV